MELGREQAAARPSGISPKMVRGSLGRRSERRRRATSPSGIGIATCQRRPLASDRNPARGSQAAARRTSIRTVHSASARMRATIDARSSGSVTLPSASKWDAAPPTSSSGSGIPHAPVKTNASRSCACARAVEPRPGLAPITAIDLSRSGLSIRGREAQSSAFFPDSTAVSRPMPSRACRHRDSLVDATELQLSAARVGHDPVAVVELAA